MVSVGQCFTCKVCHLQTQYYITQKKQKLWLWWGGCAHLFKSNELGSLYDRSNYSAVLHCKNHNVWHNMKGHHCTVAKNIKKIFFCCESNLQLDKEVVDLSSTNQFRWCICHKDGTLLIETYMYSFPVH